MSEKIQFLASQIYSFLLDLKGPLPASNPRLVLQVDEEGKPFAALCHHYANGETPELALQNLVDQLVGGSVEEKKRIGEAQAALESGAESPR